MDKEILSGGKDRNAKKQKKDSKKTLRLRAEKELGNNNDIEQMSSKEKTSVLQNKDSIEKMSSEDLKYLVHELNVHQIELEMQNEELKETRLELENSLEKYSHLYNFAPIAYLTLDQSGLIKDINITGCNMLQLEKRLLLNKRFQSFIQKDYKEKFHVFHERVFTYNTRQVCDLEVVNQKNIKSQVQLIGISSGDLIDNFQECRMAMIDVTEQKMAREIIKTSIEEKERLNIILKTQEQERKRISESLHNGVGQTLYAVKLKMDQYLKNKNKETDLLEIKAFLVEAINEVKIISFELIPPILEDFGLETVLQEMCRKFTKGNSIKFTCNVFGYDRRLETTVEIAIYRIIQELINNIVKHSMATEAKIYLTIADKIIIHVEDNGKGFSGEAAIKKIEGMGLKNIKNRVKLLDGNIEITSNVPKGTSVAINLPLTS
jgi:signal transduction histidine kinase